MNGRASELPFRVTSIVDRTIIRALPITLQIYITLARHKACRRTDRLCSGMLSLVFYVTAFAARLFLLLFVVLFLLLFIGVLLVLGYGCSGCSCASTCLVGELLFASRYFGHFVLHVLVEQAGDPNGDAPLSTACNRVF